MDVSKRKSLSGIRFLSFMIEKEEYCIDIYKIKEIMGMINITPLPRTPDFVKGVINLRGKIIPIIDLRLKFGIPFREYSDRTCIIVVEIDDDNEITLLGLVVDKPQEVLTISEDKISDVPYINTRIKAEYIRGIAEYNDSIKVILDIKNVLSDEEFVLLKKASGAKQSDR